MKKFSFIFIFTFLSTFLFADGNKILFLKGNIIDKITAIRESAGEEGIWITNKAIDYILEYKDIIGNDRELDSMAVAAVFSISSEYTDNLNEVEKQELLKKYINLFEKFNSSSTVQISIISKITLLKDSTDLSLFIDLINKYIQITNPLNSDLSVYKGIITAAGNVGNNVTFTILYNSLNDQRYKNLYPEIEKAVVNLIPVSMNEALQIAHSKNITQITKILNLIQKNNEISSNFLSEIAENALNETIMLVDNSSDKNQQLIELQLEALKILNENRWTRASETIIDFFDVAKYEYSTGIMNEEQFVSVIDSLPNIAPLSAITPLIRTLGELNLAVEMNQNVSESVVLAVINTLGTIGDKSAFDSLLSVTYLNYPESVLSAARVALAGLKW